MRRSPLLRSCLCRRPHIPLWLHACLLLALSFVYQGNLLAQNAGTNTISRPMMDLGPAVSFIFNNAATNSPLSGPSTNLVTKSLSIRVGTNAGVCFDTTTHCYAAGWIGGFIDVRKTSIATTAQGSSPIFPIGTKVFASVTPVIEGQKLKYKGHFVSGEQVVLSYAINDVVFLDLPGIEEVRGQSFLTRTLRVDLMKAPIALVMPDTKGITLLDPSGSARLETNGALITLRIARHDEPILLKVAFGSSELPLIPPVNPATLTNGGPARWTSEVTTHGKLGAEPGAYVVDTLTLPEPNPWNSWMRISGLDFFRDGRCAISTLSGDVWIVSGIDSSLKKLHWKRYASGLYEPLGLRILHDKIFVLGRDRITRLHDLNQDGEADYYESFNSDWDVYPTYHAFVFDLQGDRAGNFYFASDGNMVDPFLNKHGSLLKVSADGSTLKVFARGFRTPNGLSVGPNDEITCSDNQGHWTPASKISWIQQGEFYGYGGDPRQPRFAEYQKANSITNFEPPICWLPMNLDNSSGGQIWVTSDKWGLPRGSLLHTSYGKCTLLHVMFEDIDGQKQGGAWAFPVRFNSGMMRGRFNPEDGQLYLGGLKGWQTVAIQDGGLQRVRYTGKTLSQPVSLHVETEGIKISFGTRLNPSFANDPANYSIARWNYRWTSQYGSDSWSVADPQQKGEDSVVVKSARLSADGLSVFLETEPLKPVMQMRIKFAIETADGQTLRQEIYNTINRVK